MPARQVRKLDPAHVREVANSIRVMSSARRSPSAKDNLVIDGAVRVQAARHLGLGPVP